jgi:tetratricopeptide (TPR) repeat protein
MAMLEMFTKRGDAEARGYFERAIALDPNYALMYAGLSSTYNRDLKLEFSDDRADTAKQAFEAASKAVELDQTDSYAHAMLSIAHMWPDRYDASVIAAERAVDLNPSNPIALAILGTALKAVDRHDEAIARFDQAIQVNPRDPRLHFYYTTMARAHLGAEHYEEAASTVRNISSERPDPPTPTTSLPAPSGTWGSSRRRAPNSRPANDCSQAMSNVGCNGSPIRIRKKVIISMPACVPRVMPDRQRQGNNDDG